MRPPIHIEANGYMPCPLCGEPHTHVDDVIVAGRPAEDGPFAPVHVNNHGEIDTDNVNIDFLKKTRRHSIALVGWCENCEGNFAIEFRQNKGATEVHLHSKTWQEVRNDGENTPSTKSLDMQLIELEAQFHRGDDDDLF